jgi:hypothetical protein
MSLKGMWITSSYVDNLFTFVNSYIRLAGYALSLNELARYICELACG